MCRIRLQGSSQSKLLKFDAIKFNEALLILFNFLMFTVLGPFQQ